MKLLCAPDKLYRVLHALERGGHQRRKPHHCDVLLNGGVDDELRVNVLAQIDHGVAVVVEQNLDDVLADVVDIALDRRHNDFALADALLSALAQVLFDYVKARLRGVRALDKLGQEDFILLKIRAHFVECRNEHFVYNFHRVVIFEELFRRRSALVFKSAVNSRKDIGLGLAVVALLGLGSGGVVVLRDKLRGIFISARKHPIRPDSAGHSPGVWVNNRQIEPFLESHSQEGAVDKLAVRQSEGDV